MIDSENDGEIATEAVDLPADHLADLHDDELSDMALDRDGGCMLCCGGIYPQP